MRSPCTKLCICNMLSQLARDMSPCLVSPVNESTGKSLQLGVPLECRHEYLITDT